MKSFFESFAQVGLPGEPRIREIPSDLVCVIQDGDRICFSHRELSFAVLW